MRRRRGGAEARAGEGRGRGGKGAGGEAADGADAVVGRGVAAPAPGVADLPRVAGVGGQGPAQQGVHGQGHPRPPRPPLRRHRHPVLRPAGPTRVRPAQQGHRVAHQGRRRRHRQAPRARRRRGVPVPPGLKLQQGPPPGGGRRCRPERGRGDAGAGPPPPPPPAAAHDDEIGMQQHLRDQQGLRPLALPLREPRQGQGARQGAQRRRQGQGPRRRRHRPPRRRPRGGAHHRLLHRAAHGDGRRRRGERPRLRRAQAAAAAAGRLLAAAAGRRRDDRRLHRLRAAAPAAAAAAESRRARRDGGARLRLRRSTPHTGGAAPLRRRHRRGRRRRRGGDDALLLPAGPLHARPRGASGVGSRRRLQPQLLHVLWSCGRQQQQGDPSVQFAHLRPPPPPPAPPEAVVYSGTGGSKHTLPVQPGSRRHGRHPVRRVPALERLPPRGHEGEGEELIDPPAAKCSAFLPGWVSRHQIITTHSWENHPLLEAAISS